MENLEILTKEELIEKIETLRDKNIELEMDNFELVTFMVSVVSYARVTIKRRSEKRPPFIYKITRNKKFKISTESETDK